MIKKRNVYSHVNLLTKLKIFPKDWHNYLRMVEEIYLNLLSLVTPLIKKNDTVMRNSISPQWEVNSNGQEFGEFVADDAFPLRTDMIKSFRQADLNT